VHVAFDGEQSGDRWNARGRHATGLGGIGRRRQRLAAVIQRAGVFAQQLALYVRFQTLLILQVRTQGLLVGHVAGTALLPLVQRHRRLGQRVADVQIVEQTLRFALRRLVGDRLGTRDGGDAQRLVRRHGWFRRRGQ